MYAAKSKRGGHVRDEFQKNQTKAIGAARQRLI